MEEREIDEGVGYAGFQEALDLVRSNTRPAGTEERQLALCPGYVSAEDACAVIGSPPRDASLRDGFAVRAEDVADASPEHPTELTLIGSVFAGGSFEGRVAPGQTVKVCSGAPIPQEADAVVSSEFCDELGAVVRFKRGAGKGKNIMCAGEDVKAGMTVVNKGQVLLPARLAFAAVAGIARLKVYRKPRLAVLSVGDELVAPGQDLRDGSIYASNAVNIEAWLAMLNIPSATATVADDAGAIKSCLEKLVLEADAIITNGGSMNSERDLVVGVLQDLGWTRLFRHVRMSPGKGTSFGIWRDKPVFCLSGGPSSSATGFVALALPGIFNMLGFHDTHLLTSPARLDGQIKSRSPAWAEFKQARLVLDPEGRLSAVPLSESSRSRSMADADCLLCKPEGVESLSPGQIVTVYFMAPSWSRASVHLRPASS